MLSKNPMTLARLSTNGCDRETGYAASLKKGLLASYSAASAWRIVDLDKPGQLGGIEIGVTWFLVVILSTMTRELYRKNSPGERSGSLFAQRMSWSRLSEQLFRVDKWSVCRG
jgi:hypothetical protein